MEHDGESLVENLRILAVELDGLISAELSEDLSQRPVLKIEFSVLENTYIQKSKKLGLDGHRTRDLWHRGQRR